MPSTAKSKPSWTSKLLASKPPAVKTLQAPFAGMPTGTRMLVASPALFDEFIRTLAPGHVMTVRELRDKLAARHRAEQTCPVSTGIFLRIVAEAAWEQHQAGTPLTSITLFWRVIDPASELAAKLACGPDFIRKKVLAETPKARKG